ncbi:hypothetical protein [Albidovulum sp.]|jgi:hypothetical protein|uniref:hypothetical protein n=1 Tax=Albidovulum sp. TaxID=1872424 RepID=UPI00306AFA31
MAEATDFIGRVRERVETAEERRRRETARHPAAARYTVLVTRDGTAAEELLFDRPPTLADLVARAGAGAFLLGIGVAEATVQMAAE